MSDFLSKIFDLLVCTVLFLVLYQKKWKNKSLYRKIVNTVMFVYLTGVAYFTLMPVIGKGMYFLVPHSYGSINLIPFIDIVEDHGECIPQLLLNILLFVPLGFILPFMKRKYNAGYVFLISVVMSLSIEFLQPILPSCRTCDVTDLITNCVGGMLGYVLFCLSKRTIAKVEEKLIKAQKADKQTQQTQQTQQSQQTQHTQPLQPSQQTQHTQPLQPSQQTQRTQPSQPSQQTQKSKKN